MSRLLLAFLLTSCGPAAAVRRSMDLDELWKEDVKASQGKICTLTEIPSSKVQYGIRISFPVKGCRVECNENKIIAPRGTLVEEFLEARENDKGLCACYAKTKLAPEEEFQFLLGIKPRAMRGYTGCSADVCWTQYKSIATYAKHREMDGDGADWYAHDQIASANHYSADCKDGDAFELTMTTVGQMKKALLGDKNAGRILEGIAVDADEEELDEDEDAKLDELTESTVYVTATTAEAVTLETEASEEANTQLIDIVPLKKASSSAPTTKQMVQAVMLGPKQGVCSSSADKYKVNDDSECGQIENEGQCMDAFNRNVGFAIEKFTAFKRDGASKNAISIMQGQPAGCFMRRTGQKWHAFWNEIATREKAATGKSGKSSFEYALLCGCYKAEPPLAEDIDDWWGEDFGDDEKAFGGEKMLADVRPAESQAEDVPDALPLEDELQQVGYTAQDQDGKSTGSPQKISNGAQKPSACERKCRAGKACGDSCIQKIKQCHQPPGKACDVEPEEIIQETLKAEKAPNKKEAMEEALGNEDQVALCGAHDRAYDRAKCICDIANHWTEGDDGKKELGISSKAMKAECRELSVTAMTWAKPFGCSKMSKRIGGRRSKQYKYWCQPSSISWSSIATPAAPSSGGKVDIGSFFRS